MGSWLTATPNWMNGTELLAEEFCDSLRLQYGLPPQHLPPCCDGCDHPITVEHALSCKQGGLVLLHHNEVAVEWSHLCVTTLSHSTVSDEPIIPNSQDNGARDDAGHTAVPPDNHGDVAVCHFWKCHMTAIFDVQITDTDALSYLDQDPAGVLACQEKAKKKKHLANCLAQHKEFTPLVFSVDSLRGTEADAACKHISALLSKCWLQPYSVVCGYVRLQLALSLAWAATMCLQGSRNLMARNPSLQTDDGVGLALYQ